MILAGPKSYYDEYLRKQGTGRTLNDPPSLLTDRGAYVNFLEVQLERVSAACLGVNAYDQRFNDMQGLIVSLEQRCAATTRLVGLAQQCTEEVRLETDNKIESLSRDAREDHANVNAMFQAMSARISAAEQTLSNLSAMVGRIESLEQRAAEMDGTLRAQQLAREEERLAANVRIEELESYKRNSNDLIQKLQTEVSKQGLDLEESNKRTSSLMMSIEERLTALQTRHKEEMSEKIQETTSRISEKLQESHSKLSAEQIALMNDLEAQRKESARRVEIIEKSLPKAYNDAILNAARTACEIYRAEAEAEWLGMDEEIKQMQHSLESQSVQLHTLEEEARLQFQSIDRGLGEFTETAQMAQRRAATALQEAMAATVAVQRASHEGLLISGALFKGPGTSAGAGSTGIGMVAGTEINMLPSPPLAVPALVPATVPAAAQPTRSASPTLTASRRASLSPEHQMRHASPSSHGTGAVAAETSSSRAAAGSTARESPVATNHTRSASPRPYSPSRREQELGDSYRSRVSPFFSRVSAKDRSITASANALWFPNKNVSARLNSATQIAERQRRVAARQQAALTRAIEPHVDTIHPAPRFTDMPQETLSRAPLRQRAAAAVAAAAASGGDRVVRGPRSTQEIVESMMRQHMVSDGDDLVSLASTDSLNQLGYSAAGRYGAAPRDNLKGAAASVVRGVKR